MRLLLDTHAFLWFLAGHRSLSRRARHAIDSPHNERYLSAASVWEMAIKHSLGKLSLGLPLRGILDAGVRCGMAVLAVDAEHAAAVADLPWHHDDPFDRLLIAQARTEGLRLVTRDAAFERYEVQTLW